MNRRMKRYGFDRTALRLSDKAEYFVRNTDPLNIWEYTVNGMTLYDVSGCIENYAMTETDLNDYLEACYDEVFSADAYFK